MAEQEQTDPDTLIETIPEDVTIIGPIPISEMTEVPADVTTAETITTTDASEPKMATVQLGDLSGHSVQELAEHLPNIGIHFTCKKCNISCNQMSEVLAHFTDGQCTGNLPAEGSDTQESKTNTTAADPGQTPTTGRKRGRPKKSEVNKETSYSVTKEAEYEELPRIAAPPSVIENPTGRKTRYSTGKIKRLDVLTLLGGRIKEEPFDDDDDYTPPVQSFSPPRGRKRFSEDDYEDYGEFAAPRPRGRPRKIRINDDNVDAHLEETEYSENIEFSAREENEDLYASVTIKKEGNAQVIVVNKGVPKSSLLVEGQEEDLDESTMEQMDAIQRVSSGAQENNDGVNRTSKNHDENHEGRDHNEDRDEDIDHQNDNTVPAKPGGQSGNEDLVFQDRTEKDRPSPQTERMERVIKATQQPIHSYTNLARKKRQYKCKICKQRFFYTIEEMKIHAECHTNQKSEKEGYSCIAKECSYKTTFWSRMLDHLITHEEYLTRLRDSPFLKNILGNFSCPICKKKFERKNNMKGHMSKVHFKQDRTCEICGMVMTAVDEKTYKRHVEKCQNLLFQCSHCEYKTPVSANMRKHMKIHLGQGFVCDICQAVFPSKQRFTVHRAIHEENRQKFMCDVCGQAFMSQDAVKKHVVRFHTEVTTLFSCPECAFTTKIHTDLKKHITSVHNKKFRCAHCPFQTNSSTAFEQHQEYHKPGRSFGCGYENCYYRGATAKQLSNHIGQVHRITSKHQCPVCHKLYKKKTHLARHLVIHTGDKPYVCLDCEMAFSSHSTYYRHRQKTGHDAKREGIVSVPQNITIQYVSQQDLDLAAEDCTENIVHQLDDQTFKVVTEENGTAYIAQGVEQAEQMVQEEVAAQNQNMVILENENGEQVTYILKMGESDDGVATLVSEDGVQMDAGLAQQIHAQLKQLQETEQVEQNIADELPALQDESVQEQLQVSNSDIQILQADLVEEQIVEDQDQLIYTNGTKEAQDVERVGENIVTVMEVPQSENSEDQIHLHQEGVAQIEEAQSEEDQNEQTVVIVQEQMEGEETEQTVAEDLENNWVQLTEDGLEKSDVIRVQNTADEQQEIQHVIYEESVVEVDNPHGADGEETQYAIVLLPSSAASGDEPEAALSMLQLQSGNNMVITEEEAQLILQQQQQQQQQQQHEESSS